MGKVLVMNKTTSETTIRVGSIFYSSWGYDQTNIDWYEVVGLTCKGVKVRSIESIKEYTGSMVGTSRPRIGGYMGEIKTKMLRSHKDRYWFRVNSFSSAWEWDGNDKQFTEYA